MSILTFSPSEEPDHGMVLHKFCCHSGCGEIFYTQSKRKNGLPKCTNCGTKETVEYKGTYVIEEKKTFKMFFSSKVKGTM